MEEKKNIPLTLEQLAILVEAMNMLYEKSVRRARRHEEVRGKKAVITLADQQTLLQYLAALKNMWERGEWQDFS